jgi:hypothetical protein
MIQALGAVKIGWPENGVGSVFWLFKDVLMIAREVLYAPHMAG